MNTERKKQEQQHNHSHTATTKAKRARKILKTIHMKFRSTHTRYIARRAVCTQLTHTLTLTVTEARASTARHGTARAEQSKAINTNKNIRRNDEAYKMRHYTIVSSVTAHMRNSIAKPTFEQ